MKFDFQNVWRYLLHIFFPNTCLNCKKDLHYLETAPLCRDCSGRLKPLPELHCKKCGLPLDSGGEHCFDCRGGKAGDLKCDRIRSAFVFNAEIRSLVHAYKYKGLIRLSARLGGMMAEEFPKYPELADYKFLVAVPLAPGKEKERGFNQSGLLAEVLAEKRSLFHIKNAAARIKDTKPQARLSRKERIKNMEGAFRIVLPETIKGRKILIIDDVATTLSTIEELASELKKAGAAGVAAFTLAREP